MQHQHTYCELLNTAGDAGDCDCDCDGDDDDDDHDDDDNNDDIADDDSDDHMLEYFIIQAIYLNPPYLCRYKHVYAQCGGVINFNIGFIVCYVKLMMNHVLPVMAVYIKRIYVCTMKLVDD
uniref:Uncharacterized protein n=1 Tax=Glossina austeni TaxID=7395 RepID=A0A1A9UGL7_GLOAU